MIVRGFSLGRNDAVKGAFLLGYKYAVQAHSVAPHFGIPFTLWNHSLISLGR